MKYGVTHVYANGLAAALSVKLLTIEEYERMIDSDNTEEAIKALYEHNYGDGMLLENPNDFEKLLFAEQEALYRLFEDMMTVEECARCFLLPVDYLNAKTAMKSKYMRITPQTALMHKGTYEPAELVEAVLKDEYSNFSGFMADALSEVDNRFADGDRSPDIIDIQLDRAMYAELNELKKRVSSEGVKDYLTVNADAKNITMLYRAKNADIDASELFVTGGNIPIDDLRSYAEKGGVPVKEFVGTAFQTLVERCNDADRDKRLLYTVENEIFKLRNAALLPFKANDGIEPFMIYYLAKEAELSNVRLIMVCKKGKLPSTSVNQRLKESFYV